MFARAAKTRSAPMIKAAARISEFHRSAGRWQWVVDGRIGGWLREVGFMLLASVLQAASSAVQSQKRLQTQSNGSARAVRAVPVKLLQPYIGARTYSTSAVCANDASSRHDHSARRTLRVVAVDEQT